MLSKKIVLNVLNPEDVITNEWTVKDIYTKKIPKTWENIFNSAKNELSDINDILETQKTIHGRFYPDCDKLFYPFELTPLHTVNVVILAEHPYHQTDHNNNPIAQGLCFSIKKKIKLTPELILI